jgi:hypothetical protein
MKILEDFKHWQYFEFFIPGGEKNNKFIEALLQDSRLQGYAFDSGGEKLVGSCDNDIEVAWSRESSTLESLTGMEWGCAASMEIVT